MFKNVGGLDRVLRISIGLALITMATQGMYTPYTWVGFIPLITGLLSSCPLYKVIGLNSCPIKKD